MDIDTMEQQGRRRKSPTAHDMPRRLVGSKCLDQRVPVYWDQTVPVWPFANSPAATKLPARNADETTETSNLRHCCCTKSSRTSQCHTASSFQLVPSASPAADMISEDQSARASNSAACSSNSSTNNIIDPPAPTSTSEPHQIVATAGGNGRSSWGFSVPDQGDSCAANHVAPQMPAGTPQRHWNSRLGGRAVLCPPSVTFDAIESMYHASLSEPRRRPRPGRLTPPAMKILPKRTSSGRLLVERRIPRPWRNSSTVVNGRGSISGRAISSRSRSSAVAYLARRCASHSQVAQELHNGASWRCSWCLAMVDRSQHMGLLPVSCFALDGGGSSLGNVGTTQRNLHRQIV